MHIIFFIHLYIRNMIITIIYTILNSKAEWKKHLVRHVHFHSIFRVFGHTKKSITAAIGKYFKWRSQLTNSYNRIICLLIIITNYSYSTSMPYSCIFNDGPHLVFDGNMTKSTTFYFPFSSSKNCDNVDEIWFFPRGKNDNNSFLFVVLSLSKNVHHINPSIWYDTTNVIVMWCERVRFYRT